MNKNRNISRIFLLISLLVTPVFFLAACRSKVVTTLSPQELAVALTRSAFQQETQQARLLMTLDSRPGSEKTGETPISTQDEIVETPSPTKEASPAGVTPGLTEATITPTTMGTGFATTGTTVPTATMTATKVPTATPTRTATTAATSTFTATVPVQSIWEGVWVGYLQQADGSYRSGPLVVTVNGSQISAVFVAGEVDMALEGELAPDQSQANGRYTLPSGEGWFLWMREGNLQFRGTIDNRLAFCAAREGTGQPEPCGYFSPY